MPVFWFSHSSCLRYASAIQLCFNFAPAFPRWLDLYQATSLRPLMCLWNVSSAFHASIFQQRIPPKEVVWVCVHLVHEWHDYQPGLCSHQQVVDMLDKTSASGTLVFHLILTPCKDKSFRNGCTIFHAFDIQCTFHRCTEVW